MSDYETVSDVELTHEHFRFLKQAGSSLALREVVAVEPDDLPRGVTRNSARDEVRKRIYCGDIGPDKDPSEFTPLGGHFFNHLWEGNLYDAFVRADGNNLPLLLDVFGAATINADRREGDYPVEQLRPRYFDTDEEVAV